MNVIVIKKEKNKGDSLVNSVTEYNEKYKKVNAIIFV